LVPPPVVVATAQERDLVEMKSFDKFRRLEHGMESYKPTATPAE